MNQERINESEYVSLKEAFSTSEEMYRTLGETSDDMIFIVDLKGNFLFHNSATKKHLGYSDEEIKNINGFELVHADDEEHVKKGFTKLIEGKTIKDLEYRYRTKDGSYIFLLNNAQPIFDSEGRVYAALGIARNITQIKKKEEQLKKAYDELDTRVKKRTEELQKANEYLKVENIERKRAEEALFESEKKYRTLFEVSPASITLVDKSGIIIDCNLSTEKLIGYNKEEIIGKSFHELMTLDLNDLPKLKEKYLMLLKGEDVDPYDLRIIKKDGKRRWINITNSLLMKDEEVVGFQIISNDITDKKKAEEVLKESEEKFRLAFENAKDAIFWADAESRLITRCNKAAEELLGKDRREIIGQRQDTLHPPEKSEYYAEMFKKHIDEKGAADDEAEVITKSGEIRQVHISASVTMIGEKPIIQGIFRDITERKKAEEALRESEEKFRNLAEKSPNMIFINKMGPIVYANDKCEEDMGYTKEELYSPDFDFLSLIAPEYQDHLKSNLSTHMKGEEVEPYEYSLISKDGKRIEAILTTKLIKYEGEEAILGIVTDITKRKRIEEQLKTLSSAVEQSTSSIAILDKEGKVEYANPKLYELYGIKPDDVIGHHWQSFVSKYSTLREKINEIRETVLKKGKLWCGEVSDRSIEGEEVWRIASIYPIKDENGEITNTIYTSEDITYRKKAENALRESEEKYRTLFSTSPEAIVLIGLDGTILECNDFAEKIGEVKQEELIGKSFLELDLFEKDDLSKLMDNFQMVLNEDLSGPLEFNIKIAQEKKWIEVFPAFLKKENEVYALQLIIRDITERKKANEALCKSEEKYRSLVEEISDVIFSVDQNGIITYMSPAVETLTGYKTSEIVGKSFFNFMHKDDFAKAKEGFAQSLSGHAHPNEFRGIRKSGEIFWIRTYSQPMYEDGKIMGARGVLTDITEKKLAEEELKNSEEKYRSLVEKAGEGIATADIEGRFTYVNETLCEMLGYAREELMGKEFIEFIHPEDKGKILELFIAGLKNPTLEGTDFEFRVIHKNGKIVHFYSKPTVLWLGNEIAGFNAIITDITSRKNAEQALRESEEKFRELADLLPQTVFELDLNGYLTYSNQHGYESTGYSQADFNSGLNVFEVIHPDDHEKLKENISKTLRGKKIGPSEYKLMRKDKTAFPVLVYSRSIIHNGKPKGLRGIVVDITDIKRAEKTLMECSLKWQTTFDTIKDSICIMDTERRIIQCNKATIDFTEKPLKLILNNDFCKLIHGSDGPIQGCPFGRAKKSRRRESLVFQKNDRWYNTAVDPILDEKGNFTGAINIMEDITEIKQKEVELKRSLKERELLFRELKHRVKNNLQLLSSMVSMQSMQTENETILKKLQEVQSVIETMALIYSRAYEGPRISGLNLKSFIEELVADLMKFKTNKDMNINYEVEGEDIRLNTDQAIPMALIANELIFNSLKHAFVGRSEGYLSISLKELEESISMAIRDDGVGMAKGIEIDKTGTLGLRIVKNLTEQLQGNLEIINKNGTEFIIEVPKEEVK